MCNTPTYYDLGKAAKDVFNKGYGFGMVKIDLRTKSSSRVEFSISGHAYTDTGKASGNLETKYGIQTIFVPNTGKKSGKLKASYKQDCFSLGSNVDRGFSGLTIYGWAVWLAGYQMSFDIAADIQLHTHVNDGTEFGGSIYQKVSEIERSINLTWTAGSNNTRLALLPNASWIAELLYLPKIYNASLIGLGYTQTLQLGVTLTLSALIHGKNFNGGGHKVGLGFELEA
uniref:Non-selective voltage-gated ion channel VDAC3 n=1 Tax=Nannospalax galili TaxID=1026970 RepID=A0A8C6R3V1_NANGA